MKKITIIICLAVIICAIYTGNKIYQNKQNKRSQKEVKIAELAEKIEDDCTEEWNELQNTETKDVQANSQDDIRVSPNCSMIYEIKYERCGHTSRKYKNIPQDLVNKTEEEVSAKYPEWKVKQFESNKIVLNKTEQGECGEHYVLRDIDGKIVINIIDSEGKEKEYQKTDISTDYLTDTDKIEIKNGIKVFGKENLSQVIEDYE